MPPRIRLFFSALSVMLFFIAAVPLYSELSRRSDIWWTPHAMIAPFAESKDRAEIYAHGSLSRRSSASVERLPLLLVYAAGCGVTAFTFLLIVTGRLAYRGERKRGA